MDFDNLSEAEKAIVGQALRAAADGPFFPDWEFPTLFGLSRGEFRAIAAAWPEPLAPAEEVARAVNDSLNNLLGYPHRKDAVWQQWISVGRPELKGLLRQLRGSPDFERLV